MSRQVWYKKSGLVRWEDAKTRPVQEWIDESIKKKALDKLFGVK
jgi:hypothetical protein